MREMEGGVWYLTLAYPRQKKWRGVFGVLPWPILDKRDGKRVWSLTLAYLRQERWKGVFGVLPWPILEERDGRGCLESYLGLS